MNRVQVSLIFSDDELVEGLIEPLKSNRQLKPLIVNLLSAYYYNEEVRAIVDGEDQQSGVSDTIKELFSDARNNLLAWDILGDTLGATLEDGVGRMQEFADSDFGKPSTDEGFGTPLVKVSIPKQEVQTTQQMHQLPSGEEAEKERLSNLESQMENMMKMMTTVLSSMGNGKGSQSEVSIEGQVTNKTSTQQPSNQVSYATVLPTIGFTESVTTPVSSSSSTLSAPTKIEEQAKPKIDGRNALAGLLGSLG